MILPDSAQPNVEATQSLPVTQNWMGDLSPPCLATAVLVLARCLDKVLDRDLSCRPAGQACQNIVCPSCQLVMWPLQPHQPHPAAANAGIWERLPPSSMPHTAACVAVSEQQVASDDPLVNTDPWKESALHCEQRQLYQEDLWSRFFSVKRLWLENGNWKLAELPEEQPPTSPPNKTALPAILQVRRARGPPRAKLEAANRACKDLSARPRVITLEEFLADDTVVVEPPSVPEDCRAPLAEFPIETPPASSPELSVERAPHIAVADAPLPTLDPVRQERTNIFAKLAKVMPTMSPRERENTKAELLVIIKQQEAEQKQQR